ncbi:MAG: restriction endonuclease subunit S, partial [Planctomyces sp.]
MSFPKYPKYKDSGVEWLGEVPEHWQQIPVWLLFDIGRGRVISHEEILDNPGDYPVYSSQTENQGVMGYLSSFEFEGDFLTWTTDGANAGTVFRRSGRFNCTNVCGTLKPKTPIVSLDYCRHALAISTAYFVRHDINPKLMNNV